MESMKTAHAFRAVLAIAISAFLMAGCGSGSFFNGSIYYNLQNEQLVKDSSLSNSAHFFDVARLGTAADPVYYAASGQLRKSTTITSSSGERTITWDEAALTPPSGMICNSLVAFGGDLYGGFIPTQSTQSDPGLYKAAVAVDGTSLTSSFQQVTDSLVKGKQILRLYVSAEGGGNGRLIAVTAESPSTESTSAPYAYAVYRSADGAAFQKIYDAGTDLVKDIIWQSSTGDHWILFAKKVIRLNSVPASTTVTPSSLGTDETLTAICCSTETPGLVFLASRLGKIWKSTDSGSSWTASSAASISGIIIPLVSITEVPSAAGSAAGIYVGSEGYGYYTVGTDLSLSRFENTSFADLRASAIGRFYLDSRGSYGTTLFALTTSYGLWRGEVSSTVTWSQE
jgi:hypothetical protein